MTHQFSIHQGQGYPGLSVLFSLHVHVWNGTRKTALDISLEVDMTVLM